MRVFYRGTNNPEEVLMVSKRITLNKDKNPLTGKDEVGVLVMETPYHLHAYFSVVYKVTGEVVGCRNDKEYFLSVESLEVFYE